MNWNKLCVQVEKLGLSGTDVLTVTAANGSAHAVANRLAEDGMLPKGTAILVLTPDIDIKALKCADPDIKRKIFNAMDINDVVFDWVGQSEADSGR